MREAGWEIASHGLKWIEYKDVPEAEERAHLARRSASIPKRPASAHSDGIPAATRSTPQRPCVEEAGFLYSSDSYADDLPYWVNGPKGPHLIVPYTLDANDMRFINPQGFGRGESSSPI